MSGIITRIDSRSIKNSYFHIVDDTGYIVATVAAKDGRTEVEVRTAPNLHIEKPNGWSSK